MQSADRLLCGAGHFILPRFCSEGPAQVAKNQSVQRPFGAARWHFGSVCRRHSAL
ncbi:hypothetical protein JCM19037_756 [Geomicrobium sp. JCM 19037]|nr:hypothetical protein JCM19037_756 [Geomicrobium sp. JCM 19037]